MNHRVYSGWFPVFVLLMTLSCQSGSPPQELEKQENPQKTTSQKKAEPSTTYVKKFFQIESARIDFLYSGIFEGKETFYIGDWGNTVVVVEDKREFGNALKQTVIWKDKETTIHNHAEKKVWQGRMRTKSTEPPAVAGIAESQLEMVGYKKMPDEIVAGKRCTVYENTNLNVKYWLWKGIDLKIVNRSVGQEGYVREAVAVAENATIPENLLAIPEGYSRN